MASTSDIKNGVCINFNHDLWKIVQFLHVKPGKGAAFVRTKLKNIKNGRNLEHTFPAGAKIEIIRIETRKMQFLYAEGDGFHMMNTQDYEQIFVEKHMINAYEFMKEGEMVDIVFHAEEEMPLFGELPQYVVLEVTYTEPGEKGNTATNATKPATLETGASVQVPLFINQGDFVRIDTANAAYTERIKK
jgi:elongation factor P